MTKLEYIQLVCVHGLSEAVCVLGDLAQTLSSFCTLRGFRVSVFPL